MIQRAYFGDFKYIKLIKDYADYVAQSDVGNDFPYVFFRETIVAMTDGEFWGKDEREEIQPVIEELNVLINENSADVYFLS